MALPRSLLQYICGLVLLVACAQALKFDLQAVSQSHDAKKERCVRNFVAKDTLVVVTATVSGQKGDGMRVNMHVSAVLETTRRRGQQQGVTRLADVFPLRVSTDQRCGRKRVREATGRRRRAEDRLHVARRRRV